MATHPVTKPERRAYTAKETCEMLNISRKTLSRWEKRSLLVPLKVSRKKLFSKESIDRFMEEVA